MIERQRLLIEDVNGRRRDRPFLQRLKEIGFDYNRSARCIHKAGRRLHQREFCPTHKPARAAAEHKVDAEDIRLPKKLILRDQHGSCRSRALGGEVLAPGDDGHAEGLADLSNRTSDVTEPEQSECPSTEILSDEALPSATAQ